MAVADLGLFGTTADGQQVTCVKLASGGLRVSVLTWGSVVQSVRLDGVAHDLTLGSDHLSDYQGRMRHHGSLIGPVANRLTGAAAAIGGQLHRFEANQDGTHSLHSGAAGTHLKLWSLAGHGPDFATLTLDLPDGEGGLPGARQVTARFSLHPPATLRLEVTVTTSALTLINFANHSYWNLDGSTDWSGHSLTVHADHWLPTDSDIIPTGQIAPVAGSEMDFRKPRQITPRQNLFDTCFCLSRQRRELTEALTLTGASGISMTMATTEPGIQVYDGRDAVRPGHGPYEGLAIEAQFWPDAPNQPEFPSIELAPGQASHQITEWRFSRG